MQEAAPDPIRFPSSSTSAPVVRDFLTQVLSDGARRMLVQAVEAEVAQWIDDRRHLLDADGHRQVVRNGHAASRTVVTGVGPMRVQIPRVHDRRPAEAKERFTWAILPPYLRKAGAIDELIPWLYLKGVSTSGGGDFSEALQALVGPDCPGLSATTVTRLVAQWQDEHHDWSRRDLSGKHYVYVWADGIHFNIRLEEDRQCILVLMDATADGRKELIAVQDGFRESEQSWTTMPLDLKRRGLVIAPSVATADGAPPGVGFWAALSKVWPTTREQRCWVHKTANVLDQLPKRLPGEAKDKPHPIWMADKREQARKAFDLFVAGYEAKDPKAVECLNKDREALLTFYDFPAEHPRGWVHLRTTHPIESTFATVRPRRCVTAGPKATAHAGRAWRWSSSSPSRRRNDGDD